VRALPHRDEAHAGDTDTHHKGLGEEGDINLLLEMGQIIKDSSLCGLGQTCPNPVLSTISHFRHEYEAHIRDKQCPAGICEALTFAPARILAQYGVMRWIHALISAKRYEEALSLIRLTNPLAGICGRACNHPCEKMCKRARLMNLLPLPL